MCTAICSSNGKDLNVLNGDGDECSEWRWEMEMGDGDGDGDGEKV
jgi:hypothetical protein